jgi:hypothetical protein
MNATCRCHFCCLLLSLKCRGGFIYYANNSVAKVIGTDDFLGMAVAKFLSVLFLGVAVGLDSGAGIADLHVQLAL